jgi:SagB-type dehydrogenase family enzyme
MSRTTTANRRRQRRPRQPRQPRYRRSPHLVAWWRGDQLILEQYAGRVQIEAGPLVLDVLNRFSQWEPVERIAQEFPNVPRELLQTLIDALVEHGALETEGDTRQVTNWEGWASWTPAATFFHHSTKDVPFTARDETNRRLKARATDEPIPPALKPPYRGKKIALPPPAAIEEERLASVPPLEANAPAAEMSFNKQRGALGISGFTDVLVSRRTWRRFGRRCLSLDELSTLLGLTWGVQGWMDISGWGRMALKTSPSGGARHSIEAYVLVRNVDSIPAGVYHYQPGSHELHQLRKLTDRTARAAIAAYLPQQGFYAEASAVMLMSAVFARVQWRYAFPRAYRTVLAEAGHHAQTFCLAATWLGLAPFCTMALADTRIETDLGLDGVSESVLYATGVGPRPAGVTWAPWANTATTPVRTVNPLGRKTRRR